MVLITMINVIYLIFENTNVLIRKFRIYHQMDEHIFPSRKHALSNSLLLGILFGSLLVYIYISITDPNLRFIFLFLLIDFPLLGYILLINNTIKFTITNKTLKATWFSGSREIAMQNIIGYFEYNEPLFEFHLEANFLGAKLTRNAIGEFYYLSPGIRKGLVIEYTNGKLIERIFIVPKNMENFIDTLRLILIEIHTKNIESFNNRFYVKN